MTSPHPNTLDRLGAADSLAQPPRHLRQGLDDGLIYPVRARTLWSIASQRLRAVFSHASLVTGGPTDDGEPTRAEGIFRVAVVLAEFQGTTFGSSQAELHQRYCSLFFAETANSVRAYFRETSKAKVDITGDVFGPYSMPHPESYYANGQSGTGSSVPNAATLAEDAANAARADGQSFASFDGTGRPDRLVDGFVVIQAGPGGEHTGDARHIASHKGVLNGRRALVVDGGIKIYAYAMVAKDSPLGVICHELGHALFRLPDLYGPDGIHPGGVGNWCLMGTGNWNRSGGARGARPAHLSAWCKSKLGWVQETNIDFDGEVHLKEVKESGEVVRLWLGGQESKEYFLVENRSKQPGTFDDALPGSGLLIWHIDENQRSNDDAAHPRVCLEQADGQTHLQENGSADRGDSGDPFPGVNNNKKFAQGTTPSSRSYAGSPSGVSLEILIPNANVVLFRAAINDIATA